MSDTAVMNMSQAERREIGARNQALLAKYLGADGIPWWYPEAAAAGYFSEEFLFENPWQARGYPSVQFRGRDTWDWLEYVGMSAKHYRVTWENCHQLADPYTFWIEYYGDGECSWGRDGDYKTYNQLELTFVRLDERGRLKRFTEHYDPIRLWRTAGEPMPRFDYNEDRLRNGLAPHIMPPDTMDDYIARRAAQDPIDEAAIDVESMSDAEIRETGARNRTLLDKYMGGDGLGWWEPGATEAGYFADDFLYELPNAWPGLPISFPHGDGVVEWLNRTVMRFDVGFQCVYPTADPFAFWLEQYGEGAVTWGKGGPYKALKVLYVRLDEDGRLKRYREHFDSSVALEAAGAWKVPSMDYNADREKLGLPPHTMRGVTQEEYVQQRIADARRGVSL